MSTRTSIYFPEDVHRALKLKAVELGTSVSDVVTDAVCDALREDADDLAALQGRAKERSVDFATFVGQLKAAGKL